MTRLWVNGERTVLVTMWDDGTVTVANRETPAHTWGPPVYCKAEQPAVAGVPIADLYKPLAERS